MKSIIKVLFCILIPMLANAQNSNVDSLQREVNRYPKEDRVLEKSGKAKCSCESDSEQPKAKSRSHSPSGGKVSRKNWLEKRGSLYA